MKYDAIIEKANAMVHKAGFKMKKYSPDILTITGVIGVVSASVIACIATTKVNDILEEAKEDLNAVHKVIDKDSEHKKYTEEDGKKAVAITYVKTGLKLFRVYAPAIVVGALSITAILVSHNILKKRNVALAVAYATVDKSFSEYRNRVINKLGEKIDKEFKYGIKDTEIEETTTDENGDEIKVKKTVQTVDKTAGHSAYTKFFDAASRYWSSTPDYNQMFIIGQERHANHLLNLNGYLFLNDVYDMLDIPRTKEGQLVGWIKNKADEPTTYVDFGIFNVHREANKNFLDGREKDILLDFNVQGNIINLI